MFKDLIFWYKRNVPRSVRFALLLPGYLIATFLCLLGIAALLPVVLAMQTWENFK